MSDLKILALMSPSGVGAYAACPKKAVYDADFPPPQRPEMACYSSFGKVCHWQTQSLIGDATEADRPGQQEWTEAMEVSDVPHTVRNFQARVEQCAALAKSVIHAVTPLPAGQRWKAEEKAYNKLLLPNRVGRKGDVCGFGGSIDLVAPDRSVLWDLKFVGANKIPQEDNINPMFKPASGMMVADGGVKNEYLWQCGCYHHLTGIPRTGIVWVGRDGKARSYVLFDWATQAGREFRDSLTGFLEWVDTPTFRRVAWPIRGKTCDYCTHKDKCQCWAGGSVKNGAFKAASTQISSFSGLDDLIKSSGGTVAVPPPPPPPVIHRAATGLPLPPPPPPPTMEVPKIQGQSNFF